MGVSNMRRPEGARVIRLGQRHCLNILWEIIRTMFLFPFSWWALVELSFERLFLYATTRGYFDNYVTMCKCDWKDIGRPGPHKPVHMICWIVWKCTRSIRLYVLDLCTSSACNNRLCIYWVRLMNMFDGTKVFDVFAKKEFWDEKVHHQDINHFTSLW